MRFEINFESQQLPAWADSYVNYGLLKILLKTETPLNGKSSFPKLRLGIVPNRQPLINLVQNLNLRAIKS